MMAQTRKRQRVTMFIFLFCTSLVLKRISASSTTSSVVSTSGSSGSSSVGRTTNIVTTPISTSSVVATSGNSMTTTSGSSGSSSVGPTTNTVTTPISTSSVVATSGSSMATISGSSSVGPTTNIVTTSISASSVVATSGNSMTTTSGSSGSSSVGPTTNIVTTPISTSSVLATSGSSMTTTSGSSGSLSVGPTTNIVTTPISTSSVLAISGNSMTTTSGSSGSSSVGPTTNIVTTPVSTSSVVATSGSSTTATSGGSLLNSSPGTSSITPAGTSDSPKNSSSITPEASSTSGISTTPTVKTTPAPVQHILISDLTIDVDFTIKFNGNFSETLYDKNSQTFMDKSAEYEKNLAEVFNKTYGFKSVKVTGFWKGSIGVDYTVEYSYNAATDTENFKGNLTSVYSDLQSLPDVDTTYGNATFPAEIQKASSKGEEVKGKPCNHNVKNGCLSFWNCTKADANITCIDPCLKFDCRSPGVCFIDNAGQPRCRCPPDDKYIYGGETCEQKAEKLDLPFTTIIGIACGVGGGLVFILIVALVFTCCRRSGKDRVHDDRKSDVSFQSLTGMQGTPPDPAANRFYRQQTGQDPSTATSFLRQDSGLPMDSLDRPGFRQKDTRLEDPSPSGQTRYGEDGRVYKVVKDSQIYGPVAYKNQAFESFPEEKPLNYRRLSQSGYSRVSHQRGPRENVYDHLKESGYSGLELPDVHRNPVYNDISDETTIVYQPSDEMPRSRVSNASYQNPVMTVDPNELSGFPRRDDIRRPDEVTRISDDRSRQHDSEPRYSDWPQESYRHGEHPGAPVKVYPETETVYPARDSVFPARENAFRDSREHGYPGKKRDEAVYSKPSKAVRPGGMDDGVNPLIHDFSDRAKTQQQGTGPYSSPDKRTGADRAKVYDYVPEGKMVIHRPVYSNRPLY